jgi:hypothetical protein
MSDFVLIPRGTSVRETNLNAAVLEFMYWQRNWQILNNDLEIKIQEAVQGLWEYITET